jgi:hypothetical protein
MAYPKERDEIPGPSRGIPFLRQRDMFLRLRIIGPGGVTGKLGELARHDSPCIFDTRARLQHGFDRVGGTGKEL